MKKEKEYDETRFSADMLKEAITITKEMVNRTNAEFAAPILSVEHDDSKWDYDSFEEFLADYRKFGSYAYLAIYGGGYSLTLAIRSRSTTVTVKADKRAEIELIFDVFEKYKLSARLEPLPTSRTKMPIIFIGHGRSVVWRDLKDHLQDKHGFKIEAYETGARAGHSIRDILDEMVRSSSFALLVLTSEDEQSDGKWRARQNVIHEAGLFQGCLGFARAILLIEEGVEEFSNIHGIQHIKFSRNNIKEVYGEVLATLKREFGNHG